MDSFSSLPYFAASTMAPLIDVGDVYSDASHPWHVHLLNDLAIISDDDLVLFGNERPYLSTRNGEMSDTSLKLRLSFAICELERQIAILRKQLMLESTPIRHPYDHPELKGVGPDKDGLVYMHDFKDYNGGFFIENEVFTIAPSTDAHNSTYWVLQELHNPDLGNRVKVRFDPLIHHPKEDFNPTMYKMQVYGKSLDWERIKNLTSAEQLEFIPDSPDRGDIAKTEIIWRPSGSEIHFTCEELPREEFLPYRGSRYFHAILDRGTGKIEHCDGAIRYYDIHQYNNRLKSHIKANEVTKAGTRIKIFHVTNPTHQGLINLIASFFVWNEDVFLYFNPDLLGKKWP